MKRYPGRTQFKSVEAFFAYYEGCASCGCDHGCNEWLLSVSAKASLMHRMFLKNSNKRILDKLAGYDATRAGRIFYFLCLRDPSPDVLTDDEIEKWAPIKVNS